MKTMLCGMKEMAETGLKQRRSFRSMWYREWADLFLKSYDQDRKVVYTSIYAFPMEILAAFDVAPFDFEIAGGLMSVANLGLPLMVEAEEHGYSQDICSFHRASIGAYLKSYLPTPDLMLTTSFYCDGKTKTNDILSRLWGVRSFLLSVPQEITRESVSYVARQLRDGEKLDEDRLKEAVKSSNRSRRLLLEIHEKLKQRPVTMSPADLIGYSINGQLFWGRKTKEALEAQLLHELEERLSAKDPRPERHRILWFAWMPAYPSNLFETLKARQVSIALCETSRVHWDEIDEDNPFEGLALKCLKNPFIGPTTRRIEGLDAVIEEYGIDGGLLFATPACRHSKSSHMLLRDAFSKRGLPFLCLDMDISDPRGYLPEQIRTRVEGFIEVMDNKCHSMS